MKHVKMYEDNDFTILFENENELKNLLLKNKFFSEGDVFSGIIDVSYKHFTPKIGYDNFLEIIKTKFGLLPYFCILLGSYNGQVCNGGHMQYFDNGYASSKSRKKYDGSDYDNVNLHEKLLRLFKFLKIEQCVPKKLGEKVYSIMKDFDFDCVAFECYNGDDGQYNENDNDKHDYLEELDNRWYDVTEEFINKFNEYLKKLTLDGEKIENMLELSSNINKYNI